jgi:hypothetical protein
MVRNFFLVSTAQAIMPVPALKVSLGFSQLSLPFFPPLVSLLYCLSTQSVIIQSLNTLEGLLWVVMYSVV